MDDILKGAVAGAAAWWAMDRVLSYCYDHEGPEVQRREADARGGVPALEVMAESLAGLAGIRLSERQRQHGGKVLQWTVGVGTGMLYGAIRDRLPSTGIRRGLLYGVGVSLLFDEGLIPLLGFAPGPQAFPWQTHARGFIGHLAYGAAVEIAMSGLDRGGTAPRPSHGFAVTPGSAAHA